MVLVWREGELLTLVQTSRSIALGLALLLPTACRDADGPVSPAEATAQATAPGGLQPIEIEAEYATASFSNDPDDPAIWVHPTDPSQSLVLGTMKVAAPAGALAAFGMDGQLRQLVTGLDRPNNVDVEYGFVLGGRSLDIAVVTERLARQLRIFAISSGDSPLTDLGGVPILEGAPGEEGAPMGIGLYKRPRDGAIFAIVSPKEGPRDGYLWQYRLTEDRGRPGARFVRRFGRFSGPTANRDDNEIEAVAVDDDLGFVYYADEGDGIHKWHADPDHPDAGLELAHFGQQDFTGDREGIGIYARPDGTGYLICTDQIDDDSRYVVYRREGQPGRPHDHQQPIAILHGGADATDGLDVSARPLGPGLSVGAMVAMNSGPRNFLVFRWQDLVEAAGPPFKLNRSTN